MPTLPPPDFSDFERLEIRIGRVVAARPNEGARDPALALDIDFGDAGMRQSSAKITDLYTAEDIVGRSVVAVTGFAPMRVGGYRSDVLVLGALTADGVVLLAPDRPVAPGSVVA